MSTGIVNIRGKEYKTVALRVNEFRATNPNWTIATEVLSADDQRVTVKASVMNEDGRVIATGHAEEERDASNINKTSALENCETSAIGRALAVLGLAGTEMASADEVANAIKQEAQKEYYEKINRLHQAVKDNLEAVESCRDFIADGDLMAAIEVMETVTDEDREAMQVAFTKGGWFTTEEVAVMKSDQWGAAKREFLAMKRATK